MGNIGNSAESYKEPAMGWMVGFLFVVCFVGLFVLIPLRKVSIYEVDEECSIHINLFVKSNSSLNFPFTFAHLFFLFWFLKVEFQ